MESGLASQDDVPEVVESNFRYKGPHPQSKETGIVSLADIVESATRSMGKISCEEKMCIRDRVEVVEYVPPRSGSIGRTGGAAASVRSGALHA